jgi:hypothetical protein
MAQPSKHMWAASLGTGGDMHIEEHFAHHKYFYNGLGGGEIRVAELPSSPLQTKKKSLCSSLNQPESPTNIPLATLDNLNDPLATPIDNMSTWGGDEKHIV